MAHCYTSKSDKQSGFLCGFFPHHFSSQSPNCQPKRNNVIRLSELTCGKKRDDLAWTVRNWGSYLAHLSRRSLLQPSRNPTGIWMGKTWPSWLTRQYGNKTSQARPAVGPNRELTVYMPGDMSLDRVNLAVTTYPWVKSTPHTRSLT